MELSSNCSSAHFRKPNLRGRPDSAEHRKEEVISRQNEHQDQELYTRTVKTPYGQGQPYLMKVSHATKTQ
jgi:hypothetical protein